MLTLILRYVVLGAAVVALNFALPRLLPGDPLASVASDGLGGSGATLTLQQQAQLRATYRLDQPLAEQFGGYLTDLAHADLGWSISRSAPVSRLIGERVAWTLALVLTALLIAGVAGAALGLLAAWRGSRWDHAVVSVCSGVAALPEFLVAMLLLLTLALGAGWFPLQGGQTPFTPTDTSWAESLADTMAHLALPAATLVIANLAAFVLLSRGAVRARRDISQTGYSAGTARSRRLAARRTSHCGAG